jgi:hypothetical protein
MPSADERTTRDWPWNDAEEPASESAEEAKEVEEGSSLDAPSSPEPSWQPEMPAWDRPTPRSERTAMPLGGSMDGAQQTTRPRRSTAARKASTTRKRTTARKSTTRKSPKRVAAGKKAATARKRRTTAARKASTTRSGSRKAASRRAR